MNAGSPGPKYVVSSLKSDHTVAPGRSGSSGWRHSNTWHRISAPVQPASPAGRPRCVRYQAASASRSRARKKTPPRPVTRAVGGLVRAGLRGAGLVRSLEGLPAAAARDGIRVAEREPAAHQSVDEVDLRALEVHRAHRVDYHANAVLLHDRIVLFSALGEGHAIREARAPTRCDVDAQREVAAVLLREDLLELVRRPRGP